jgi:type I restriction-modification system DNA methylase subunit
LRLFIDDATEYQEFDLYRISQEEFRLLYLLLNKNSFFDDMPAKLKEATAYHEKNVTEKLYKNYKAFKDELFKDVCHYNKKFDKLTLFKKTQKLLDRLLFIFFAEDAGLIPANANVKMFDDFKALNEIYDCKVTLYSRYQKLFGALDKGHIYKNWGKIPAYNGGLFRPDEILDSSDFLVSDNILLRHCATMAEYDFNSEVDVNILGHIFEHSMGEVEEIAAELEGTAIEKDKTRRKKDGVFYTPRYITRYIVNATLGVLCAQKCAELGIDNIILEEAKDTADKATLLLELQKYKTWLLGLKILDPACGSGAFLNQTLDFLVAEHRRVNALIANISGAEAEAESNNDDKQILENNIFGVDINDESAEIAKLSLWLRTAQRGRTLSDLSNNIKCGNSLIDAPEIAGDKAFDWNAEFPEIMQNGGFDVVLGNPPYVRADTENAEFVKQRKHLESSPNYQTLYEKWDLMVPFYERTLKLLKPDGLHCFIVSNSLTTSKYALKLHEWIIKNYNLISIDYFDDIEVFKNVGVIPAITLIKNQQPDLQYTKITHKRELDNIVVDTLIFDSHADVLPIKVFKQHYQDIDMTVSTVLLQNICYISKGMVINADEKTAKGTFAKDDLISKTKTSRCTKPFIEGKDLKRYQIERVKFLEWNTERVPSQLSRPTFPQLYEGDKILRGAITEAIFDDTGIVCNHSAFVFKLYKDLAGLQQKSIDMAVQKLMPHTRAELEAISANFSLKYILAILNSKYAIYFLNNSRRHRLKNYFYPDDFRNLPIPQISLEAQQPFIQNVNLILDLHKQLVDKTETFLSVLASTWKINYSAVLLSFYELDTKAFFAELTKQKIEIFPKDRPEWIKYFNTSCAEINAIRQTISDTDAQINRMVYALYGLTAEEIASIERD